MSVDSGHTATEYGIVLGLVALAAVASLFLFGDSVSSTLGNIASQTADGGQAFSILSPVRKNIPFREGPIIPSKITSYSAESGLISFPTTTEATGASNATSVEGSATAVSAQLKELADTWRSADGQPLAPFLKARIIDLAIKGENIATMQESALMNPNDATANLQGLTDKAGEYIIGHQAVMQLLGPLQNNPDYQQLNQLIDSYSGIITGVNAKNFIEQTAQIDSSQYVIGNPPPGLVEGTATVDSPVVTSITADKIEATAE